MAQNVKDIAVGIAVLTATGLAVFAIFKARGAISGAAENVKNIATKSLNPASEENVVNRAANTVVQGVTGDDNATVGTVAFDLAQRLRALFGGVLGSGTTPVFNPTARDAPTGLPCHDPVTGVFDAECQARRTREALGISAIVPPELRPVDFT